MKNSDVFTSSGYDMVVAVTQKSINDQIKHLANPDIGVIKTRYGYQTMPTSSFSPASS